MRRLATALLSGALLVGPAAAPAAATEADAPYAQAAAQVAANGSLLLQKNIDTATRPGAGTYCLHVSDPTIDLTTAIVTTGISGGGAGTAIRVWTAPIFLCNNATDTLAVRITDANFSPIDQAFWVVIN